MSDKILCETHAHTSEVSGCGRLMAREVAARVKHAGCCLLIITDHFIPERVHRGTYKEDVEHFYTGYLAAREAGETLGLHVLPGMEVRFEDSPEDYLVYGLSREDVLDMGYCLHKPLGTFHNMVNERGGLVYQAHPFRDNMRRATPRDIDGVEVMNGNPRHNSRNDCALRFARDNSLLMIAGSDIHQPGDEGSAGILLPGVPEDEKAFARMLAVLTFGEIKTLR